MGERQAATPTTIDDYVAGFPDGPREVLEQVCEALRRAVPGGEEKIRYGMPAIMFADRYGIHFAGWKKHVGLYPVGELDADLEAEVAPHRTTKDTVRFLYAEPVPYDLIERLARRLAAKHAA
ncbi:iron chaperone [Terrabacter sp. MAHUQ-38]|uniref:iron chaperone n=1 Tax=unclassified Terrabacter TaxID=2630222 RepID=UPI00351C111A